MEWYQLGRFIYNSLTDGKLKKVVIFILGIIMATSILLFSIISIPAIIVSIPFSSFQSEQKIQDRTVYYTDILVEYKYKIHDKVRILKKDYLNNGYEITSVNIGYPTLSMILAYDNVINKDKYFSDDIEDIENVEIEKLSKAKVNQFLIQCMKYYHENKIIVAKVKPIEEIAKLVFNNQEDIDLFISYYTVFKDSGIDSSVPEIKYVDLEYLLGGIKLPYISQKDKRWAYEPYGDSNIIESGCGIASMCMVLNGLKPDLNILPPELAIWSNNHGFYVSGAGTAWAIFSSLATKHDLNMKNMSRNNPQEILNELGKGHPVVVSMSAGHFTTGGHFIVLRGIDENGKILVSDPWSEQNSNIAWDFSLILNESSTLSSACFWSFSTK